MLSRTTVESIALLQRLSNTRSKEITLDVDMEDYHRMAIYQLVVSITRAYELIRDLKMCQV